MDGFSSVEALYKRLTPALKSKRKELIRLGITSISEKDIWYCLRDTKWIKSMNLTLSDMVNDIMTVSEKNIIKYKNEKVDIN